MSLLFIVTEMERATVPLGNVFATLDTKAPIALLVYPIVLVLSVTLVFNYHFQFFIIFNIFAFLVCDPITTCKGKGVCNVTGHCLCEDGYDGPTCEKCKDNLYGPDCNIRRNFFFFFFNYYHMKYIN